jgi:hypothetical protein
VRRQKDKGGDLSCLSDKEADKAREEAWAEVENRVEWLGRDQVQDQVVIVFVHIAVKK